MKKHVILFLAANPRDNGRLTLDREARAIHVELKRSGYRDRFDFVTRWASGPLDLLRELRELKPTIVHFSGHGAQPAGTTAQEQGRDVSGAIHDDTARNFAIGFSGGLGEYESIAAAFKHGRAAIHLDGLPEADRPQLQVRDGFDAAQITLAAIAPSDLVATPCPYPGMRPFAADDAGRFHGREARSPS